MKVFALVLLCALAAVQGRSAVTKSSVTKAEQGENPWLVHLRIAVATSGLLETSVGSLIGPRWVLTAFGSVTNSRFIWIRYGAVVVVNPSLVIESNIAPLVNSVKNIALINANRYVQSTDNIAPIALGYLELPSFGSFCGYGANADGGPGEVLNCFDITLESEGNAIVPSGGGDITRFDIGAPVVVGGKQVGVVVAGDPKDDSFDAVVVPVSDAIEWIESQTGMTLTGRSQGDIIDN